MRHITLNYIKGLVASQPKLEQDRKPAPMPGRRWPTRVAWYIKIAQVYYKPNQPPAVRNVRVLSYIGKPNRYRALEARNFLTKITAPGWAIVEMWQAEFDREGLVAYITQTVGRRAITGSAGAFKAYHPLSAQVEVVEAFTRPFYLKYIGGMRFYSLKKKLPMQAVLNYYDWYEQQFKKRLRKPKPVPTMHMPQATPIQEASNGEESSATETPV